jgi:hypothetical protein
MRTGHDHCRACEAHCDVVGYPGELVFDPSRPDGTDAAKNCDRLSRDRRRRCRLHESLQNVGRSGCEHAEVHLHIPDSAVRRVQLVSKPFDLRARPQAEPVLAWLHTRRHGLRFQAAVPLVSSRVFAMS